MVKYSPTIWDASNEDYDKLYPLVRQGYADWGLPLLSCCLPVGESGKFDPVQTPTFEKDSPGLKVAKFRIIVKAKNKIRIL